MKFGKNKLFYGSQIPKTQYLHLIRVCNILPPVVVDSVFSSHGFRKVIHPPDMVLTGIPVAPLCGGDFTSHTFEIREVVKPVVTFADHS